MNAYLRLMRLDKPVGIALLWAPTGAALWMANQGHPPWSLVLCFLLGTFLMRSAGCVINDMADRNIDKHVQRTRSRPLTSGEVSFKSALILLVLLLALSASILVALPKGCWIEALLALLITAIYPLCKRFFQAPQVVLGVAFSMGIPMAYTASGSSPDKAMGLLLLLNMFWILAYDTLYAMNDKADDLRIGVKSTPVWWGDKTLPVVIALSLLTQALWCLLGFMLGMSIWFMGCWLSALLLMFKQVLLIRQDRYFDAFLWHGAYGLLIWVSFFKFSF